MLRFTRLKNKVYNESCDFPSPRERVKKKMKSSICCFRSTPHIEGVAPMEQLEEVKSRTRRSPHIKEKCKNLIARIGKGGRKHHNSSDFSYDPLTYALNFEDESSRYDELHIINFTSRLPSTPEQSSAVKSLEATPVPVTRELYAYS